MMSGLTSSMSMSLDTKAAYSWPSSLAPCFGEVALEVQRFRQRTAMVWEDARGGGSIWMVMIFSGVWAATSSMSMPPSVEATTATRLVSRSTSRER